METIKRYYPNGQLYERYTLNDKQQFDGTFEWWHKNGQKKLKCNFTDGKLNGVQERWHENGDIREKQYYIDDQEVSQEEYELKMKN